MWCGNPESLKFEGDHFSSMNGVLAMRIKVTIHRYWEL